MTIKLVVFDSYGIALEGGYWDTCKYLGKKYKRDWKDLHKIFYRKYFNMAAERKITQQQAWEKALKESRIPLTVKEAKKIHYGLMGLKRENAMLAKRLKATTLLLSKNTRSQWHDTSKLFKTPSYFDHAINTWELRLPKASKETCRYVLKRFKVKPEEVLWLDDQPENLIEPRKMGIRTLLFRGQKQFERDFWKTYP